MNVSKYGDSCISVVEHKAAVFRTPTKNAKQACLLKILLV